MPLLADPRRPGLRAMLERMARVVAFALLALLLFDAWRDRPSATTRTSDARALDSALVRWSTFDAPAHARIRVNGEISAVQRDWLAALEAAGTRVTWEGSGIVATAAVADPIADPTGGTAVLVAAPAGTRAILSDAYGPLDSVSAQRGGARFVARSDPDPVNVRAGPLIARAATRDSLLLGRVLVLGAVGWETKFVVAALEERGWKVDARLALGPKGDVLQAAGRARTFAIDTSDYSAVIAIDSSAVRYASQIAAYVRSGGGLVASPGVFGIPALSSLGAGPAQRLVEAVEPFAADTAAPRRSLALRPIALLSDAVPLELRDSSVAIGARRVERGRVVVVGYEDTWRWRMAGGADAVERHRDWWADLVASVAYASRVPRPIAADLNEAPYARLVDALGPAGPASDLGGQRRLPVALIAALLALSLLGEWTSRRLRGAP